MNMNILFFYRVYPNYGGVEVVTTVLANRFIKDGHGVIIASIEQPHIELACQLLPDVKLVKLDYPVCSIKKSLPLDFVILNLSDTSSLFLYICGDFFLKSLYISYLSPLST